MISEKVLDILRCPACFHPRLINRDKKDPELVCESCERSYPVIDGIPDMVVPEADQQVETYRTETVSNLFGGVYDFLAPFMSMGIWRCSPLRYIDSENRAIGRAEDGVYLAAPIGTGLTLAPVLADYHEATIVGVDKSWKMLRQAARRLRPKDLKVQLIRADYERLPLKDATVRSLQSLNGLHTFNDRIKVLQEFNRCIEEDGHLSGSALIRSQEDVADAFLERYERYGIYPMLRSPEFLLQEVRTTPFSEVRYETRGAVLFFTGEKGQHSR